MRLNFMIAIIVLMRLGWLLIDLVTKKVYLRSPSVYIHVLSLSE